MKAKPPTSATMMIDNTKSNGTVAASGIISVYPLLFAKKLPNTFAARKEKYVPITGTPARQAGALTRSAPCEAVDVSNRSLGFFTSQAEAAAALQELSVHGSQDGDVEPDL
jgi:hypothetical protein